MRAVLFGTAKLLVVVVNRVVIWTFDFPARWQFGLCILLRPLVSVLGRVGFDALSDKKVCLDAGFCIKWSMFVTFA